MHLICSLNNDLTCECKKEKKEDIRKKTRKRIRERINRNGDLVYYRGATGSGANTVSTTTWNNGWTASASS